MPGPLGGQEGRWISFRPAESISFSSGASRRKRMALVVLLRGVNVGGHRTFRPATLAEQLKHLDAVNIGAAGILLMRQPPTPARLRAAIATRLSFESRSMVWPGPERVQASSRNPFIG